MKHKAREILYLVLSIFTLWKLILFSVIFPLPHSVGTFFLLLFLGILSLFNFKLFKIEKDKNYIEYTCKKMGKYSENYKNEKETVDTMVDILYDSLLPSVKSSLSIIINFNEDYVVDFFYNLQKYAKNNSMDINEITKFQKAACLMDSLVSPTAWVFKTTNTDEISTRKLTSLNIELAVKSGLLYCGFTVEEINDAISYTSYLSILLYEAYRYTSLGDTMVISMMADLLDSFTTSK